MFWLVYNGSYFRIFVKCFRVYFDIGYGGSDGLYGYVELFDYVVVDIVCYFYLCV